MDFIVSVIIIAIYYLCEINLRINDEDYIKLKKQFVFIKKIVGDLKGII